MDNQDEPTDWAAKDITIPLLLSGVFATVICVALCALLYPSRDLIANKMTLNPGKLQSAVVLLPCPAIPAGWQMTMNDNFDNNNYDWSVGKNTNTYADTELNIEEGLLNFTIKAKQGVFSARDPFNYSVRDFYLSSKVRKVDGPQDAEYGLTFRIIGDQILFFAIQDSGMVSVQVRDAEKEWQPDIINGYSQNINVGEVNDLVVFVRSEHYVFCVNQYIVFEEKIYDYRIGKMGIAVELENAGDEATFEFDDFIIHAREK